MMFDKTDPQVKIKNPLVEKKNYGVSMEEDGLQNSCLFEAFPAIILNLLTELT